ncbi:glutathione S-transferase family protein [Caldimonas thermodepolymerans]|jgi:glutathione S-transferase|uniref:glutathione S-transferase family protein n=1 Tax=Caldimonas thermodepolymerans TaxID=215580 RepID=UPI0022363E50|nr:glutathione S-transferase family protein [Caldimonas thermodepolymerans]UZG46074.1 glutathione S-transferase family protein [Caldimonas thermodepolymerans]
MLTLYHAPGQLSSRIIWLLEELEAEYELVLTHFPQPDGSGADPNNPHPHGYAPALLHDGRLVTETGAIALYLTDLFPGSSLGVPVGDPQRGAYLSWLFYQVGMTEPLVNMQAAQLLQHFAPFAHLNDAMWRHLLHTLGSHPYMMGERFTAVDILYIELFERLRPVLGPHELIDAYIARGNRPARQRAKLRGRGR